MSNEWSYNDIPISDFKVITEPNLITGEIKQITEIAGKIQTEIIQTKSEQIRNALIDLGWKPPEGPEHVPESKLPESFERERWLIAAHECHMYGVKLVDMSWHDLLAAAAFAFCEWGNWQHNGQRGERTTPS